MRRWPVVGWLAGDAVALSVFVVVGVLTHEKIFTLIRFGLNIVPLLAVWVPVAWIWGALRVTEWRSVREMWFRTLTAWLVAAPFGLILRAWLIGSKSLIIVFVLVATGMGGAFLLLWRTAAWRWLAHGKIASAKETQP